MSNQAVKSPGRDVLEFEAGPEKERLDRFLARCVPGLSLTRIRRAIAEGEVLVNGAISAKGMRLAPGDRVSLWVSPTERTATTPEALAFEVLHEDDEIIVVNKPAGMLVHPSRLEKSGTLANGLVYHFLQRSGRPLRPGIIHRLDRDTSGIIVVAKTVRAHRLLSKAFRERRIMKTYLALVKGRVAPEAGEIDAPIGWEASAWPRWRVIDQGRPAQTRYRVKRRFEQATLLELEPLTGRTHQLRIHCAFIGHPIIGDRLYGEAAADMAEALELKHQLLHAATLAFRHPATGEPLTFAAPLPPVMKQVLELLGSGSSATETEAQICQIMMS